MRNFVAYRGLVLVRAIYVKVMFNVFGYSTCSRLGISTKCGGECC